MRNLQWIGIVLVVLGIGGLVIQNVGPVEFHKEEEQQVRVPTVAGIGAIVAGLALVVLSQRKQ